MKQQIISEAYSKALEEHELDVIGDPEVQDADTLELPESGPFTFTVDVEVTPEVKLPEFSSISVERPDGGVDDAKVDAEVTKLADQFGSMEEAPEGFTTQEGDYVRSDLKVLAGEDAGDDAEAILDLPGATRCSTARTRTSRATSPASSSATWASGWSARPPATWSGSR